MDILVMLEENPDHSPVLAHVNSVPSPLHSSERPSRDIVTLYGEPSPESLALALAAAVESHRSHDGRTEAIRHLGVWPERGAIGDAAWRDATGQLVTSDLKIPLETLHLDGKAVAARVWPVDSSVGCRAFDARLARRCAAGDQCVDRTDRWDHRASVRSARDGHGAASRGRRPRIRN